MLTYELDTDSERKAVYIKGPEGAVQFVCLDLGNGKLMPMDVGYHSPTPRYEGQYGDENCHVIGKQCYYDGSSLSADIYLRTLVNKGDQALIDKLVGYYNSVFNTSHESIDLKTIQHNELKQLTQ
jgi:hypothetical protein